MKPVYVSNSLSSPRWLLKCKFFDLILKNKVQKTRFKFKQGGKSPLQSSFSSIALMYSPLCCTGATLPRLEEVDLAEEGRD